MAFREIDVVAGHKEGFLAYSVGVIFKNWTISRETIGLCFPLNIRRPTFLHEQAPSPLTGL